MKRVMIWLAMTTMWTRAVLAHSGSEGHHGTGGMVPHVHIGDLVAPLIVLAVLFLVGVGVRAFSQRGDHKNDPR